MIERGPDSFSDKSGAEQAHEALLERLEQVCRKPVKVRAPQSLQPTPEAAKSRAARLRRKRLFVQRSRRPGDKIDSAAS